MPWTTLNYNGVTISNCFGTKVVEEPVFDATNTDILYIKKTISVNGNIHTKALDIHGVSVGSSQNTSGVASAYQNVSKRIMENRKPFSFGINGDAMVTAQPAPVGAGSLQGVDVHNGPIPKRFTVNKIINARIIEVSFEIEVALINCVSLNNSTGVLSNRWSVEDTIDQNMYTTRTWDGVMILSSAALQPNFGGHAYRNLVIPPLQRGFIRKSMHFIQAADGLTFRWTVTDEQTSNAPPHPATTWTGTHSIRTDEYGKTFEDLSVHLEGPEGGNGFKAALISLAGAIGIAKTRAATIEGGKKLQHMAMVDHIHQNAVDLQLSFLVVGKGLDFAALTLSATQFGQPLNLPGYDRLEGLTPLTYGTITPTGLWASYLQSPCNDQHGIPNVTDSRPSDRVERTSGGIPVTIEEGTVTQINSTTTTVSQASEDNIYTLYTTDSEYLFQPHYVMCPIAKRSSGSGGSQGQGNQDTAVFVQVAQPTCKRILRVHAERVGNWPEVPKAEVFTDGETQIKFYPLGDVRIKIAVPEQTADGKKDLFAVECEYLYGMSRAPTAGEKLRIGSMPWQNRDLSYMPPPSSGAAPIA